MGLEIWPGLPVKEMIYLWETECVEQCQTTTDINQDKQITITSDMFAREDINQDQQLNFDVAMYAQVSAVAKKA